MASPPPSNPPPHLSQTWHLTPSSSSLYLQRPVGIVTQAEEVVPLYLDVHPAQAWWWLIVDFLRGPTNRIPAPMVARIIAAVLPEKSMWN